MLKRSGNLSNSMYGVYKNFHTNVPHMHTVYNIIQYTNGCILTIYFSKSIHSLTQNMHKLHSIGTYRYEKAKDQHEAQKLLRTHRVYDRKYIK